MATSSDSPSPAASSGPNSHGEVSHPLNTSIASITVQNVAGMVPTELNPQNYITWPSLFMGVLSNKINRDLLKPGDHIYSWRHGFLYSHHGIYDGEGKVIHFTRRAGKEIDKGTVLHRFLLRSSPSHSSDNPCPNCGYQSTLDGVISSCIDCFLSGGDLYLFQYGVNPAFFVAQARGGTCTLARSDPPKDVLLRASFLLQNGFGSYDVFKNNCEDFAIYCKTGLLGFTMGRSGQAASLGAAAMAVRFLTTSFTVLHVVGCGMYCIHRFVSDIGMRGDVMKVPAERLITPPCHRRVSGCN